MITIDTLLKQLQQMGVHYIKSNSTIMLEILESKSNRASEIDMLIHELLMKLPNNPFKKIMLECPKQLLNRLKCTNATMKSIGERVVYTKTLIMLEDFVVPDYEVWSIAENKSILFLSEVMQKTYSDTENFLKQMSEELPSQAANMFTVYKVNNKPVGVVLPHIEPRSDSEGRIFWIGMHPSFRGKGMGKALHLIGLYRLKNDFKANTYLGITKNDNHAMKKVMLLNGCIQNENKVISLEYFTEK